MRLARTGLAHGETVNNADRQLTERLARLRGAGLGFSRTTTAVFAAVQAVPGTELRTIAFDGSGALRATVAAKGEGQITDVKTRIESAGFAVQLSTLTNNGGYLLGRTDGDACDERPAAPLVRRAVAARAAADPGDARAWRRRRCCGAD